MQTVVCRNELPFTMHMSVCCGCISEFDRNSRYLHARFVPSVRISDFMFAPDGTRPIVQRCQIHKRRNILAHLPEKHHDEPYRQLALAYGETDYKRGLKQLQTTARWLKRISPDAAASLREGMEETLTVVKLDLPEQLRRTLATTNPIESAPSVTRRVTARVTRWRDGDMRRRWCTAGLLRAEQKFRRVKGYRHLAQLERALNPHRQGPSLEDKRHAA